MSFRFDYDRETGQVLPSSRAEPFGPDRIFDKSLVEIWIRRAQVAILSPHVESSTFLDMSYTQLKEFMEQEKGRMKKFEKNKICIDIEDPEATDLAFVDLPGLIQNESPETINLVRSLVESNIEKDNTIILVTIPASDDMENQGSALLAREADPEGKRTIGVVTKPDTLTPGATSAREKWKGIFEGRQHRLLNGYYCVRLPDDDERTRGISRSEAEQKSKEYLDSTPPWSEIHDRGRFGVQNLIKDVSKLLMQVIEDALPKIKQRIAQLLLKTLEELGALPPAPLLNANATSEILLRVADFCNHVKTLVYGSGVDKELIQQNRETYKQFKAAIRLSAPDFRPFDDWEECEKPNWDQLELNRFDRSPYQPLLQVAPLDLKGVRDVIKSSIDWHLPGHVPFEANKMLIKKSIDLWKTSVLLYFGEVAKRLSEAIESLITSWFSQFRQLENLVRMSVLQELENLEADAKKDVLKALKLEQSPYFTQNGHYLESTREEWFRKYNYARTYQGRYIKTVADAEDYSEDDSGPRRPYVISDKFSNVERRVLSDLATLGHPNLSIDDLTRLYPVDEFQQELKLMADVRAYFQVAYKRIIDTIPLTIEHSLNQAFSDGLQSALFESLRVGRATEEEMRDLLSEDTEIAAKRADLEGKKARLIDMQHKISSFVTR